MKAVIRYRNGDTEETDFAGRDDIVSDILQSWVSDCARDRSNLLNPPAGIWFVADELGDVWDPKSEPHWKGSVTVRTALVWSPKDEDPEGGYEVSCAVEKGETWLDALERQYPLTYEALVSFRDDSYEEDEYLNIGIPEDSDMALYLFTGKYKAVRSRNVARKPVRKTGKAVAKKKTAGRSAVPVAKKKPVRKVSVAKKTVSKAKKPVRKAPAKKGARR